VYLLQGFFYILASNSPAAPVDCNLQVNILYFLIDLIGRFLKNNYHLVA
jgi:hypothetical protein